MKNKAGRLHSGTGNRLVSILSLPFWHLSHRLYALKILLVVKLVIDSAQKGAGIVKVVVDFISLLEITGSFLIKRINLLGAQCVVCCIGEAAAFRFIDGIALLAELIADLKQRTRVLFFYFI